MAAKKANKMEEKIFIYMDNAMYKWVLKQSVKSNLSQSAYIRYILHDVMVNHPECTPTIQMLGKQKKVIPSVI